MDEKTKDKIRRSYNYARSIRKMTEPQIQLTPAQLEKILSYSEQIEADLKPMVGFTVME